MSIQFNPNQQPVRFSGEEIGPKAKLSNQEIDAATGALSNELKQLTADDFRSSGDIKEPGLNVPDGVKIPEGMTAEQYWDIVDSCKPKERYQPSEEGVEANRKLLAEINGTPLLSDKSFVSPLRVLTQLFSPEKVDQFDATTQGQTFAGLCKAVKAKTNGTTTELSDLVKTQLQNLGLADDQGEIKPEVAKAVKEGLEETPYRSGGTTVNLNPNNWADDLKAKAAALFNQN